MQTVGTFWALVPSLLTIAIALISKNVNLSLIIGILTGVLLFCGFDPLPSLTTLVEVIQTNVTANFGNLLFAVLLGMFIWLITHAGASEQAGRWAQRRINTRRAAQFSTFFVGILIFVDDYFNCLSVGTVMRPLTDRMKISREKLAYIIDTTAAPVCILAPVSSWAAGVTSSLPKDVRIDGFQLFLKTIFTNYYAVFSLIMVFMLILLNLDFGKMRRYEAEAMAAPPRQEASETAPAGDAPRGKAKVIDLILPIVFLIVTTVLFMAYTGGITKGVGLIDAFANCDAITACCIGTFLSDLLLLVLYVPRKIFSFKQYMEALVEGFRYMAPAMLLLSLAWTIGGICGGDYLNAGAYIAGVVDRFNVPLMMMPVLFFVASVLLSFATGTSWGTFMILIPMEIAVFSGIESGLLVLTTAAVLGGSVCGDHLSPISDTTILSSTGAGCEHIRHVNSQLPYGITAAALALGAYVLAGLTGSNWLGLAVGAGALIGLLIVLKLISSRRAASVPQQVA